MRPEKPDVFFDIKIDGKPVGRIVMELFYDIVPKAAENFRFLCAHDDGPEQGYRNCKFFKIVEGFMCQSGDYTTNRGLGGRSIYGIYFDDENYTVKHDTKGILSMANDGKNKNAAQFFILAEPAEWLDGHHVAFGRIIEGYDEVMPKIMEQGTLSGRPKKTVVIADCGEVLTPEQQLEKIERDRLHAEHKARVAEERRLIMEKKQAEYDAEFEMKVQAQYARMAAEKAAEEAAKKEKKRKRRERIRCL